MAFEEITPAERIRELSAINAEIAAMLRSAGQAVNSLTDRPLTNDNDNEEDEDAQMSGTQTTATTKDRREAFEKHTKAFYTGEQSVMAKLRRQVYALEEAGITDEGTSALQAAKGGQPGQPPARSTITNGGMGNLDIGWLNSRGNKVGVEKEHELVREARELLEGEAACRDGT